MSCGMGISADGRRGLCFHKSVAFAGDLSGCGSDMRLAAETAAGGILSETCLQLIFVVKQVLSSSANKSLYLSNKKFF